MRTQVRGVHWKAIVLKWYDLSAWRVFIEDTLQGKTLDESAGKLGIYIPFHCMELEAQDNGEDEGLTG